MTTKKWAGIIAQCASAVLFFKRLAFVEDLHFLSKQRFGACFFA